VKGAFGGRGYPVLWVKGCDCVLGTNNMCCYMVVACWGKLIPSSINVAA